MEHNNYIPSSEVMEWENFSEEAMDFEDFDSSLAELCEMFERLEIDPVTELCKKFKQMKIS